MLPAFPNSRAIGLRGTDPVAAATSQALSASSGIVGALGLATAVTGPLAPFVAAAGAIVGLVANLVGNSGCGNTCTQATAVANAVEQQLKNNLAAWQSSTKTVSQQQAALAVFDYAYSKLLQGCNVPSLGNAGSRCVVERLSPSFCNANPQYIAQASSLGTTCGRFPWPLWYRDPVANDPAVVPDPVVTVTGPGGVVYTGGTSGSTDVLASLGLGSLDPMTLIGIGLVLAAVVIS